MNETNNMRKDFEAWELKHRDQTGFWPSCFDAYQAATKRATAVTNAQIVQLRKDAIRAATVAFSLMVIHSPDELPDDAQQLAEWLEINELHLLPVDDDAEVLFIDIIREAIRQGSKV